jgi:hypothetical protein
MANRYAPYKARYLSREPKVLLCKFTHVGVENLNTSYPAPLNQGIYSINCTGAGVYQIHLGAITGESSDCVNTAHTSNRVDPYAYLAGISVAFSEDDQVFFVSNDQVSNTTTPFVEITCEISGSATNVSANAYAVITLVDSKD